MFDRPGRINLVNVLQGLVNQRLRRLAIDGVFQQAHQISDFGQFVPPFKFHFTDWFHDYVIVLQMSSHSVCKGPLKSFTPKERLKRSKNNAAIDYSPDAEND